MKYVIIEEIATADLASRVDTHLGEGFELQGGPFLTRQGMLAQAMTYKEKTKIKPLNFQALKVVASWNYIMKPFKGVTQIRVLSDKDKKRIESLIRTEFKDIEDWDNYFKALTKSDFVTKNQKGWRPNITWAIRDQTLANMVNGVYSNG